MDLIEKANTILYTKNRHDLFVRMIAFIEHENCPYSNIGQNDTHTWQIENRRSDAYQAVARNLPEGWKARRLTRWGACPSISASGSSLAILHSFTAPPWSHDARLMASLGWVSVAPGWNVIHDTWHRWPAEYGKFVSLLLLVLFSGLVPEL